MLVKLRRRFTILCVVLTGAVLAIACLLACNMARAQIIGSYREGFDIQSDSVGFLLVGLRSVEQSRIVQLEKNNGLLIFAFENGVALQPESDYKKQDRSRLFDAAMEQFAREAPELTVGPEIQYGFDVTILSALSDSGETYWAKFMSIPTSDENWYTVIQIKSNLGQQEALLRATLLYAGIFVGGLALLAMVGWLLARRSVRPVEEAQQRQREFIAAASHELKSPLAVIASGADLIASGNADDSTVRHIRREAKRASNLVDDLLLLAGAETGKWTIKKTPTNVEDMLMGVYESFLALAAEKHLALEIRLPEESLPLVGMDEERIVQVLSVILTNAIQYSPAETAVLLGGRVRAKVLELEVQDHGPGIPDEEKKLIFESFYSAQYAQKGRTDKDHFGLGLAVAKQLVELHEGRVWVADTPGGGVTFVVEIPL